MRGKKGVPHRDPADPPRHRANKARGHGSWDTDRPPVCGVVGRASGHVRLTVTRRSDRTALERVVRKASWPMAGRLRDPGQFVTTVTSDSPR
jgi:hypothetical protein